jgi:hypothetical protein
MLSFLTRVRERLKPLINVVVVKLDMFCTCSLFNFAIILYLNYHIPNENIFHSVA